MFHMDPGLDLPPKLLTCDFGIHAPTCYPVSWLISSTPCITPLPVHTSGICSYGVMVYWVVIMWLYWRIFTLKPLWKWENCLLCTVTDEILHEEGKGGDGSIGLQSSSISCSRCWKREWIHLLESHVESRMPLHSPFRPLCCSQRWVALVHRILDP